MSGLIHASSIVYNDQKNIINSSIQFGNVTFPKFPITYINPIHSFDKSYIYLNPWASHFGHFVLETLSRIWLAKELPHIPIICPVPIGIKPLNNSWQQEILNVLDINNEIIFIDKPVRVQKLYVPFPLACHGEYYVPDYFNTLAVFESKEVITNKKIYLSRSNFSHGMVNELEIEQYAKNLGYEIIIPENIPIQELLNQICCAEKILLIEGSALFNFCFVKNIKAEVEIIPRHRTSQLMKLANALNLKYLEMENTKLDNKAAWIATYKVNIENLDFALKNKKYQNLEKYAFNYQDVINLEEKQNSCMKLKFPFLENLQKAYYTEDIERQENLIKNAEKSFNEYLLKGIDFHIEYVNALFSFYPLFEAYNNHRKVLNLEPFIMPKEIIKKYKLKYFFYRIISELTFGTKRNYYKNIKRIVSNDIKNFKENT